MKVSNPHACTLTSRHHWQGHTGCRHVRQCSIFAQRPCLKKDGHGGNLLGVGLEAVAQVAAVRQVQAHDAVVRVEERRVHLPGTPEQATLRPWYFNEPVQGAWNRPKALMILPLAQRQLHQMQIITNEHRQFSKDC